MNRTLSVTCVLTSALWLAGLTLAVLTVVLNWRLGGLVACCVVAAAVLHLRNLTLGNRQALWEAFEMGRETGRAEVRNLRP